MRMSKPIRVLIWDENPQHRSFEIYPNSLNSAIAVGIGKLDSSKQLEINTANLYLSIPDKRATRLISIIVRHKISVSVNCTVVSSLTFFIPFNAKPLVISSLGIAS
jgi:hypothetical protein